MQSALVPPVVTPEGTATTSVCSTASVTSLIPLKRRIPQAPVFITRHVPQSSFISDASTPLPRTYYFDDDYPSIAASESTAAPEPPLSQQHPSLLSQPRRPSVTGAIRRRISLARRQDDRTLPYAIAHKLKRTSFEQDSVLDDWNRSRNRSSTTSSRLHHSQPFTCGAFAFRSLFARHQRPSPPKSPVQQRRTLQRPLHRSHQHQNTLQSTAIVPDSARQTQEDIQFVSTLAYEDFMHGRNRPSKSLRVFARLRRS
ncbi:unnamed protein product [Agarophyton chilense]